MSVCCTIYLFAKWALLWNLRLSPKKSANHQRSLVIHSTGLWQKKKKKKLLEVIGPSIDLYPASILNMGVDNPMFCNSVSFSISRRWFFDNRKIRPLRGEKALGYKRKSIPLNSVKAMNTSKNRLFSNHSRVVGALLYLPLFQRI